LKAVLLAWVFLPDFKENMFFRLGLDLLQLVTRRLV